MTRRILLAAIVGVSLVLVIGLTFAIADRMSPDRETYGQPRPPGEDFTVRLTLSPAAAPNPALKYELLPRLRDKTPGNAADGYNRVFVPMEKAMLAGHDPKFEEHYRWLAGPQDEFPVDEARQLVTRNAERIHAVEKAALSEYCNWNLLTRVRADGINTSLPEIQPAREVAQMLAIRSRLELIDGKIDESIRTVRTMLQVAKHLGHGETHLHPLAAAGISFYAIGRVEELIQHPEAPNLYWALSGLPRPFTNPTPALEGDDISFRKMFPIIDKFEGKPVSKAEADKVVAEFFANLEKWGDKKDDEMGDDLAATLGQEVIINRQHEAAKKELIARGRPAKEVEAMPAKQAVFLASWERYRTLMDNATKWFRQPYPAALVGLEQMQIQFKKAKEDAIANDDVFGVPLILMTPAFDKTFPGHVRLDRRIAALRTIEALRLHAVANGGKFPAKLEEVTAVAVPDDPATGKPFGYTLRGNTATLTGPPPEGQKPDRTNALRYELNARPVK